MAGQFVGDNSKYQGRKSDKVPPKTGSYPTPKPERAQHRMEAIPESAWADRGGDRGLNSRQPASRIPPEATSETNDYASRLIDRGGQFFTQK